MRISSLASVAIVAMLGPALAQDADRPRSDRDTGREMHEIRPDRGRDAGAVGINRVDRADERRSGDRDRDIKRIEERDNRLDRAGVHHDRVDVDHDRVREDVRGRDRTVHEGAVVREGTRRDVDASVRRHVSIRPERRTRIREEFVKTYKEQVPADVNVRVGSRLPERVIIERVPDTYYEDEPDLRGLGYYVDRGHAYLVDPGSREVIDDLD